MYLADRSGKGNLLTIRNGDGRGGWPDLSRLQTWLVPVVALIPKGPFEKVVNDSPPSSAVVLSAASEVNHSPKVGHGAFQEQTVPAFYLACHAERCGDLARLPAAPPRTRSVPLSTVSVLCELPTR